MYHEDPKFQEIVAKARAFRAEGKLPEKPQVIADKVTVQLEIQRV